MFSNGIPWPSRKRKDEWLVKIQKEKVMTLEQKIADYTMPGYEDDELFVRGEE
jgi:hypothetical protein